MKANLYLGILFILSFISCEKEDSVRIKFAQKAGVVLSFDDKAISNWILADSLLQNWNWKATFCVSEIHTFTNDEIQNLQYLQSVGHEIAGHGLNHLNSVEFISSHGISNYINQEITPMIKLFEEKSLILNSFAYPFGSRNKKTDETLLNYFEILRGTTYGIKKPSEQDCFFTYSSLVYGLGIDEQYSHFSEDYLFDLLSYAKNNSRILILYVHLPGENAELSVNMSTLKLICNYIQENDMYFYTLSDLKEMLK